MCDSIKRINLHNNSQQLPIMVSIVLGKIAQICAHLAHFPSFLVWSRIVSTDEISMDVLKDTMYNISLIQNIKS